MRPSLILSAFSLFAAVSATSSPSSPDVHVKRSIDDMSATEGFHELFKRDFSELEKRGWFDDLVKKLLDELKKGSCQGALTIMKYGAKISTKILLDIIAEACVLTKVQDADVCRGIVALEGPTIAEIVKNMDTTSRTSSYLCAAYLGFGQYPSMIPNPALTNGLPAVPPSRPALPASGNTFKFIHVTDTHVDRQYTPGANTNCTKPICCRSWTAKDAPGSPDNKSPAGKWGARNCDTPEITQRALYDAMLSVAPDADFKIFTGDLIEAAVWLVDQKEATEDINAFYNQMAAGWSSKNGKRVFPVIGNHDTAPVNLFPINGANWVYDTMKNLWKNWIGAAPGPSNHWYSGSYSYLARPRLRIISLSTNFWYKLNFHIYKGNSLDGPSDPQGMLAWFKNELKGAQAAGESVFIIGHMPLGVSDAVRDHSHNFNAITRAYATTIKGMFFGHTHTDEFEITYATNDPANFKAENALITAYVAPAVTPRNNNPSFRVYEVDASTFAVVDYTTYAADIENVGNGIPVFQKVYSAKEAYGSLVSPPLGRGDEMSPSFWHKVTQVFENNEAEFQAWWSRRRAGAAPGACNADCKRVEICQMRASASPLNCAKPGIDFGFKKRSLDKRLTFSEAEAREHLQAAVHQHYNAECGSRLPEIMAAMLLDKRAMRNMVVKVEESTPKKLSLKSAVLDVLFD